MRTLARLCRLLDTTPWEILASHEEGNGFRNALMDFVHDRLEEGKAPGYVNNYAKAVRSWRDFNGLELRGVKVGRTTATPTLADEQVPTAEQLRDLLMAATPRGRAVISLLAFSGVQPGVLGNFNGTDGLRLKEFCDLEVAGERLSLRGPRPPFASVRSSRRSRTRT
jgi:hypothetical protein